MSSFSANNISDKWNEVTVQANALWPLTRLLTLRCAQWVETVARVDELKARIKMLDMQGKRFNQKYLEQHSAAN